MKLLTILFFLIIANNSLASYKCVLDGARTQFDTCASSISLEGNVCYRGSVAKAISVLELIGDDLLDEDSIVEIRQLHDNRIEYIYVPYAGEDFKVTINRCVGN
ncbi:hypothetical protein [Halobacteriovorax sp. HLS]|uniref:hypothetical protein n=1 Tax=Halobacteriovorax sp. HLS TaxID=2234000 RepID=UPI000FD91936|nr:hypothetical protein [Halobacteriovorax sp. HLS]